MLNNGSVLTGRDKLKVCIVGGGNIGSLLLGDLGKRRDVSVSLLTSKPERWGRVMEVYTSDDILKYSGNIDKVSNKPEEVIAEADIILCTVPSHVFPGIFNKIKPYFKPGAWIGVMPGSGGVEFYAKDLVTDGYTLFGFQRVHGISRIKEYGKSVYDLGKKSELFIGSIPADKIGEVKKVVEELLGIPCHTLSNYLNVTLTPSNPILHTTRLYSMFRDYQEGMYWDRPIYFYEEWTDDSSRILIACDDELQKMCRMIKGLDLRGVKSLKEHYESDTVEKMTKKIKSIKAFKGIATPMVKTDKGFVPDFQSRYFLEDFPYGLCIIKGFCDVVGLETPAIDKVLMWFEKIAKVSYYKDGKFAGPDLEGLPIPKNFGIKTVEDIVRFYN